MSQVNGAKQSSCVYCNQHVYGKGCPYSPSKVHMHVNDPRKCIYCGQVAYGCGCPYNPFGKQHIHGVEYNLMMKESLYKSFTAGIFLTRLQQPIVESDAYKLKLVDEEGRRLKIPETLEERNAFTPLDAYIFRLRRLVGESNFSLLNSSVVLSILSEPLEEEVFDSTKYENEVRIQQRVEHVIEDYKSILLDAQKNGIRSEVVENMFIEKVLESKNDE